MAGKVAKAHVTKFPVHEFNNASYLESNQPGVWTMEQNEVLNQLREESFKRRVEILEQLLITVRRNGGRLPYNDPKAIFNGLSLALSDTNWDVRLKCIQLINEVIPQFGDDLDTCMNVILGKLIPNIGESKITVRRAVIQTLHVYMKYTNNVQVLLKAIVQHGLENGDPRVRKETVISLPMLFTPEFQRENFFEITQSLAKKLLDNSVEDNIRECALTTMDKIKNLVGEREFGVYIQKLSTPLRRYYCQLTGMEVDFSEGYSSTASTPRNSKPPFSKSPKVVDQSPPMMNGPPNTSRAQYVDSFEFGIIPSHVMKQIGDQENFKLRAQGVEELKNLVKDLQSTDVTSNLLPHMMPFISFLSNLLDDSNFKITTVTLEILNILVEKLGQNVKQYLKPLSSTLAKRMGDNKIVVRQAVMRVAIKMMQSYQPKPVLTVIFDNIHHKNSRVRLDTVNIIIAALLTFPSYDFDLPRICQVVAPALCDNKRQVRQATLECLSVIAQAMGQGRLQPLVHAVDGVELSAEGEGVMAAVQARLARRQLPKLNHEGLVEYAMPIPSSAQSRTGNHVHGADVDWVLAVGNSGSARHISRSDTLEIESVTSSARSTPAVSTIENGTPGPSRRFKSASMRSNFPWEDERDAREKRSQQGSINDGPPKPMRATWAGDESTEVNHTPKQRKPPQRRITVVGINAAEDQQSQQESGSYKQMHLNKLKKNYGSTGKINTNTIGGLDLAEVERAKTKKAVDRPPVKPFLELRSSETDVGSPNFSNEDSWRGTNDESPFPSKPALARSATRRPAKRVPPIAAAQSERFSSSKEDDQDSAYEDSVERGLYDESKSEMMNSLKSIRSSASKKKEEQIEKYGSHSRSSSPSADLHESGIWSTISSNGESDTGSISNRSKKSKKAESPFESRPKLARTNSFSKKKPESSPEDSGISSAGNSGVIRIDYNPASGVTFRENKTSNVQVVGKGYNDDQEALDRRASVGGLNKVRDRRRMQKGPLLSPLGVASMHSYGAVEWDDEKMPTQDSIGVVGKGMFDSSNGAEHAVNAGNSQSGDRHDRKPPRSDRKDFTSGVVGISINRQGSNDEPGMEEADDLSVEDDNSKAMSKAMKDRLAKAQRQKEEELEQQRIEREKKKQEHDEKLRKERERQQEKLKRLNTSESIPVTTPKKSPSPRKKAGSGPPTMNGNASHPVSASSNGLYESDNPSDWQPYKDPEGAIREAHQNLNSSDWEAKCSGVNTIRRLVMYHPETVNVQLHTVVLAMLNEVKNLRSQVSRLAIVALGDMFTNLKKSMDADVEITAKALLAKNGESNGFIREDVEKSLHAMVEFITPQRSLLALIAGGATHKNVQVRKTTSRFVVELVEKMGPGRILSGVKDVTDRVLPTAAHFVMDASQETRYNGRRILYTLMVHQDFNKMLSKHLPANTLRNIQDIVEGLKTKGLGDMPHEASSARGGRGPASRASSIVRGGSANSELQHSTPSKRLLRTDDATQEAIKNMTNLISANDWRDRHKGISMLLEMCEENTDVVVMNIVKIFDKFLPRLQDPNSKVNLFALSVMLQIVPILRDSLTQVMSMAIGNIAPNLSSKNKEIYQTAMEIINSLTEHLDGGQLLQPLANQAQSASARSKPDLVTKVAELVTKVYQRKQKQVVLHVLPLLWHLLGATNSSGAVQGGSSSIRTATATLVNSLYNQMGPALLEKATSDPNVTPRHLQLLQEMIDR
ncbi:TOG array regulator of axonemal microtubules protein 1-like isoform X2 [Saccostrea cucullata]|uniref:TOG array regulator of axonemal microtubules protein 1-like isoform X2 n=1 Tax=Saccostrea cuccullata TaxID=36930 RepID=UPI002ED19551